MFVKLNEQHNEHSVIQNCCNKYSRQAFVWGRENDQNPLASSVWFGIAYTTSPILKTSCNYIGRKTLVEKKKCVLLGANSSQIFEFLIF